MKNKTKSVSLAAMTLAIGLLASAVPAAVAAPADNPNRPVPFIPPHQDVPAGALCDFPVAIDVVGKTKVIGDLLGDHTVTSPGLKVTTTNTATGVSVKYTATGVSRYKVATANGTKYFEVVSTGQNLLSSTELGGLFFVRGNVNYAVTLDVPEKQQEVRPFVPNVDALDQVNAVNICDPLEPKS
jgi:hypothetical protein